MVDVVNIKVLFFASARDLVGVSSKEYILPSQTSVAGIIETISKTSPGILKIKDSLIISVNQEYCEPSQLITLSHGDEVAVIPPISGVATKCRQEDLDQVVKLEPFLDSNGSCDCPTSFWDDSYVDPKFIQINASREEIDRRIKAFQDRKREEINVLNIFEFCQSEAGKDGEDSCARTGAVFMKSKGNKSHLKHTKVKNEWGPLVDMDRKELDPFRNVTQGTTLNSLTEGISGEHRSFSFAREGIEERLLAAEEHLNCKPRKLSVFSRIKALEDRILFLEGMSPEYFAHAGSISNSFGSSKMKEEKATDDDMSLDEVEGEIFALKKKLKSKQIGLDL